MLSKFTQIILHIGIEGLQEILRFFETIIGQGYEVSHIYEEKESGFVDERAELTKVLNLTKEDTDAVFVWEISRLSGRTVMVLSTMYQAVERLALVLR